MINVMKKAQIKALYRSPAKKRRETEIVAIEETHEL